MSDEQSESLDAFAPENIAVIQWIATARLYDVAMALLREKNPKAHREILEAHAGGLLLGPSPSFGGIFATDELNPPQSLQE